MVWSSMEPNVPAATWKVRSRQSVCTRVAPFNTTTRAFRETDLKRTGHGVHVHGSLHEELLSLTTQYEVNCGRAEHDSKRDARDKHVWIERKLDHITTIFTIYCVEHCPLSGIYVTHTTIRELHSFPSLAHANGSNWTSQGRFWSTELDWSNCRDHVVSNDMGKRPMQNFRRKWPWPVSRYYSEIRRGYVGKA